MKVIIDSREKDRVKSATEYYEQQGLEVQIAELEIGDYVFNEKVVFEFKLIPDFINSVKSGRVFNQAIQQSENFPYHYVVIMGTEKDLKRTLAIYTNNNIRFKYQNYLGAIARLNTFTNVIEMNTAHINEAYYRMRIQAEKCLDDKRPVKIVSKKDENPCINWLCYCIHGISIKKAKLIVEELDLRNLKDLLDISLDDLLNIKGVGPKTAKKIMDAIK